MFLNLKVNLPRIPTEGIGKSSRDQARVGSTHDSSFHTTRDTLLLAVFTYVCVCVSVFFKVTNYALIYKIHTKVLGSKSYVRRKCIFPSFISEI